MCFAYFVDFGTRNLKLESVSFVKTGVRTPDFLVDVNNASFNGVPITTVKNVLTYSLQYDTPAPLAFLCDHCEGN
jgi:hypothetical protein